MLSYSTTRYGAGIGRYDAGSVFEALNGKSTDAQGSGEYDAWARATNAFVTRSAATGPMLTSCGHWDC